MIQINSKHNRLELNLTAIKMGEDLCIILKGGEEHLGSVTVGNRESVETFSFKDHKEYIITEMMSEFIRKEYSGSLVICCGIHFDNITKNEISEISDMCFHMSKELCSKLKYNISGGI